MDTLSGKVVLITGAARGIGAETARALAGRGAKLVLVDLDEAPLREVATQLKAEACVADVRNLDDMQRAVDGGIAAYGGIDLVHRQCRNRQLRIGPAGRPATFQRVIDINVMGVFHTVRATLPSRDRTQRLRPRRLLTGRVHAGARLGRVQREQGRSRALRQRASSRGEATEASTSVAAHMSWIDTPMVQDAKSDLRRSRSCSRSARPPGKTITVEQCAEAFVDGLAKRSATSTYRGGWVRRLVPAVVTSRVGDRGTLTHVPTILPLMDEEVAPPRPVDSARNTHSS